MLLFCDALFFDTRNVRRTGRHRMILTLRDKVRRKGSCIVGITGYAYTFKRASDISPHTHACMLRMFKHRQTLQLEGLGLG